MRETIPVGAVFAAVVLMMGASVVQAGFPPSSLVFPNAPVDYTTSAGAFFPPAFSIQATPVVQAFLNASSNPFYNNTTHVYTSGLISDTNYSVGVSATLKEGSPVDGSGVPIGSSGIMVSDASFANVPAGFEGPAGTNEVHTQVLSLNMTDNSGNALRAGSAANNGTPNSFGEIESTTGNPANDFPAKSFFDIFVDVDVPGLGTLTNVDPNNAANSTPLVIQNISVSDAYNLIPAFNFDAGPVNLYFLTVNPNLGNLVIAGDTAGTLTLANAHIAATPLPPALWGAAWLFVIALVVRVRRGMC